MKKRKMLSLIAIAVSLGLAVLAFFVLPDSVIIQFSINSSGNSEVPKLVAILIPTAFGIGGALASLLEKNVENEKIFGKGLIVSFVGIILFIFMMLVNSVVK